MSIAEPNELGRTPDELLKILSEDAVLVDVRSLSEYKVGHMPGAKSIPASQLLANPLDTVFGSSPLAQPDQTTIVVVCDSGARSRLVATELQKAGFKSVFLTGGLMAWIKAGQFLLPGPPR